MARHKKHSGMIDMLIKSQPDIQKRGFEKAIAQVASQNDWFDVHEEAWGFRPDAYRIGHDDKLIEIHEAVNTHLPKPLTLKKMAMFWHTADCEEWDVKLFVHLEGSATPSEVDLAYWYYDILAEVERLNPPSSQETEL